MTPVKKLLKKIRRLWLLEHCAHAGLLIAGIVADLVLLCLLLHRLAGLDLAAIAVPAALGLLAAAGLAVVARARVPKADVLARLMDERCGTNDLFASSLEFEREPGRFGWLGGLTCRLAAERALTVRIPAQWSLGKRREWSAILGAAAVLGLALAGLHFWSGHGAAHSGTPTQVAEAPATAPRAKPEEKAAAQPAAPEATKPTEEAAAPPPTPDAVKITNEMIDKYLASMPSGPEELDLTGVTPARWDTDEVSGKNDPSRQAGEKIDPVKLDAALLKDLETAKKTKAEGTKDDAGVTVAVMADSTSPTKAKGDKGGSGDSLANAVSKDPRGEASRLAVKPARKGLQVISSGRTPSRERGQDRPMGLLDFLTALEQLKRMAADAPDPGSPETARPPKDNPVRQEEVGEGAATLADDYFDELRKADR